MSKRSTFIVIIVILAAGFSLWFFTRRSVPPVQMELPPGAITKTSPLKKETKRTSEATIISQALSSIIPNVYPPWSGGRAMSLDDPRWKVSRDRQEHDPYWEGKVQIDFYGKVVDEKNQPVADAIAKFGWTDLSPQGSTQKETHSDGAGLFSLNGVRGKFLEVDVEMDGYEIVRSKNRNGFSYASFWEENFYEADPNNPVLFHLRKKGEAAPMVYWERKTKVAIGTPATVQIDSRTQMQFELMSNDHPRKGRWEARVTMLGGELMPAVEEFPCEAPITGYVLGVVIDLKTPRPPTWINDHGDATQGGMFYLKMGQLYGRMEIEMTPGNDWFRVKVWLNPSGSRNLEPGSGLLFQDMEAYNRYMADHPQPAK